jgi:hypothetical protein
MTAEANSCSSWPRGIRNQIGQPGINKRSHVEKRIQTKYGPYVQVATIRSEFIQRRIQSPGGGIVFVWLSARGRIVLGIVTEQLWRQFLNCFCRAFNRPKVFPAAGAVFDDAYSFLPSLKPQLNYEYLRRTFVPRIVNKDRGAMCLSH